MKEETVDKSKTLFGCFLVLFFLSGAGKVSSMYFIETINQYNVDRKQASFPFVLQSLMYPLAGPLAGYLEHLFGIKVVITSGCLVATISMGACYFAESILAITLLWGIIFGMAHGFSCLVIPSLLNKNFPKDMSKSNGLIYAGGAIGGVLMPPIIDVCLQFYGYSGSFLIMSAIIAHSLPASLLCTIPPDKLESKIPDNTAQTYTNIVETKITKLNIPCTLQISNEVENTKHELSAAVKINNVSNFECKQISDVSNSHSNRFSVDSSYKSSNREQIPEIFSKRLLMFRKFAIFLDPAFLLILIITAGTGYMITTMNTIIVDVVRDKGIKENLFVYYVIIFYASELVGHFISGFIIDRHYCSYLVATSISFLSCGLFTVAFIFLKNYILVMVCVVFIALFLASLMLLPISLTHEYMEKDTRTMGISCRYILHTPMSLAVPYAIGYFREGKGSYNGVLYISVGISIFSACVVHFIPHLVKLRQNTTSSDTSKNTHL